MTTPDHIDDQIAAYFAAHVSGLSYNTGTDADNVFTGRIPATDFSGIVVLTAPSSPADPYTDIKYLNVDIWSRNNSTQANKAWHEQIHTLLHGTGLDNVTLGNYTVFNVMALSPPEGEEMPSDPNENDVRKSSFRATFRKLP